jgi:hypothetical protein
LNQPLGTKSLISHYRIVSKIGAGGMGEVWLSAATLGQLGQTDRAKKSLAELLAIRPDFLTAACDDLNKWFEADLVEHLMEGLRKAGLEGEGETGEAETR